MSLDKITGLRVKIDEDTYSSPYEFQTFADNVFLNRQNNSPTLQDTLNDHLFRVGLTNVNLNDIVTPGFYSCATSANSATITNKPMGLNDTEFVMQVLQIDAVGNKIQQILTSMNSGAIWTRSRTATGSGEYTWTIWTGSYGASSVIPSNSNLNDYIEPGVYVSQTQAVSSSLVNSPTTSTGFVLLVFSAGKDTVGRSQLALQIGTVISNKMWTRTKTGDGWGAWTNYNFFGLAQFQIAANTDLNTLFTTGTYRCTSNAIAATLVNCPTNVAFIMDVRHSFSASYVYQIIIPQPGDCIYIRQCKTDGTDFDDWSKYSSDTTLTTIPSNTDLNTINETGIYVSPDSTTTGSLQNCPTTGTGGILHCYKYTGSRYIQVWLMAASAAGIWVRAYSASGWGRWKKQDMLSWTGEAIPANANLNDYIEPGVYRCTSATVATSLTNCPTDIAFVMEVRNSISGTYLIQTIYTYTADQSYRRRVTLSSSAFSSAGNWIKTQNPLLVNATDANGDVIIGTPDNIVNYCKTNSISPTNQIYTYGFVGGTDAIFDTAGMTVINRFTSTNYGWMLCLSDKVDQAPIHIAYSSGTTTVNRLESTCNKGYIKQLTASDDLFTLTPGHYRIYNALPTSTPIDIDPVQKFGYVTVYYENSYTYYDLVAGSGDYLNQGRWIGWKKGGASSSTISWMRLDNNGLGKDLPANANLNNYTSAGLYRCSTETTAKTLLNRPIDTTFIMEVRYHESTSSRLQIIYQTNGQAQYIRYGTVSNNVWSWNPWHKYQGDASATTRKILFIGDSYCEGYSHDGNNNGWAWYCGSEYLNLQGTIEKIPVTKNGTTTQMDKSNYNTPNQNNAAVDATPSDQFERMYRGGAKFYHSTYTTGYTFKELLIQAHTRFPNSIFTDIIVCGGYNDRTNTAAQIESAIVDFIDQAKTYYPNVQVYIGHVGYNKQGSSSDTSVAPSNWTEIRQHMKEIGIPAYKNCIKYGAIYLNNVEYALNETGLTATDGYHPSEAGNRCIAKAVAKAFLYGSAPIVNPNLFYNSTTNTITNKQKILFLGDSYLEGFTHGTHNDGWGKYCGDALGLSTTDERVYGAGGHDPRKANNTYADQSPYDDYERLYVGGIKFSIPSSTISFTSVIQIAHDVKFINYDFTDIVACAGFGDKTYTETEILLGIEAFCNKVKELYPNANIYIGHISSLKQGNDSEHALPNWVTEKNNLLDHVIPAYHQCARYGARYLTNVEYALTDKGLMDDDGYCPNEEGNRSIGTAIANALLTGAAPFPVIHKKYLFLGDSYLEGFSNEESEFNDGWGKYCGDALGLVTTIVDPHLATDPCKVTSSVNDSTRNDDYERLYVGGARMAYGTDSENLSFKYLITQAPTKFPGYKFTDIVACAGYGDRTYSITQILSGIEEFCTKAKQLYPEATIHIGHISWNKLGTSSSAPSSSNYTTWHNYLINKTIPAYQQCSLYGAHYLNNVEYWLGDSGLGVDGYSANQSGNKKLGVAIANALLTGSAPLPYKNDYRIT